MEQPILIEHQITQLRANAAEVETICDAELGRRVIYLTRANVLVGVCRSTLAAMTHAEASATPGDFDDAWQALRQRLAQCEKQFERIISGAADIPAIPCRPVNRSGRN